MNIMDRRRMLSNLALTPLAFSGMVGIGSEAMAEKANRSSRGPLADYFSDLVLRNQDNKSVRFYDDLVKGKIVVFNFMYTQCDGTCSQVMSHLVKAQKILGKRVGRDIFMYSITLKPEEDTPRMLKEFAKMYGVKDGWQFLTGDPQDIATLRYKLGMGSRTIVDAYKKPHLMIRFGNDALERWAMCPGVMSPAGIARNILFVDWPKNRLARQIEEQKRALEAQQKKAQAQQKVA